MIHILWCKIDTTQNFQTYLKKIPKPFQDNILRYRRAEDQWLKLLGKLLLLKGMELLGHADVNLNTLQYTKYKRPYLKQKPDFNISHSGTHVMCAFSTQNAIGVDIEKINTIDINDFKNVLSHKEWLHINQADDTLKQFYSYWTAKESLLKADGRGITVELDKVHINTTHGTFENKQWFLQKIDFNPAYAVHIASDALIENIHLHEININHL
ncbi:4'-phosphopantetheinyl transferase family protein [Kordia jejudonensis]|uniref:4'-phosphopantetheinyl transferase family protein n=1 Tax=Kordia jejudonensis TaxID=1348245 RepID=UPI00062966A0|nr:4'-phosphopantetheinyl transferase superfamily protein [Kordia jejudonensis]